MVDVYINNLYYLFISIMENIIIRKYQTSDKGPLRQLCCDVADKGGVIEGCIFDRELGADLLTGYYTDFEPSSTFVAIEGDGVVGYVNGCLDNRRYGLVILFFLVPRALLTCITRGLVFRKDFWRFMSVVSRNGQRLLSWRKQSFHSHQGHMHIGIAQDHRHHHIGRRLVELLCEYARAHGTQEITASVHSGNLAACRFFDCLGFQVRERISMVSIRRNHLENYESLLYVKKIAFGDNLDDFQPFRRFYNFLKGNKRRCYYTRKFGG
jgi:ribosomal protein S18 acetylase RimI-like enzyme